MIMLMMDIKSRASLVSSISSENSSIIPVCINRTINPTAIATARISMINTNTASRIVKPNRFFLSAFFMRASMRRLFFKGISKKQRLGRPCSIFLRKDYGKYCILKYTTINVVIAALKTLIIFQPNVVLSLTSFNCSLVYSLLISLNSSTVCFLKLNICNI